jgi:hypothetical protein
MDSKEYRIRVPRTARYRVLGDPSSCEEVWFVIHGYGQTAAGFVSTFEALPGAGGARCVVAPEALSRFYVEREIGPHGAESRVGASWMTRAAREQEIQDYVGYLDRVAAAVLRPGDGADVGLEPVSPDLLDGGRLRPVVLGFSQGCETASRWVTYGRIRPAELVLWGGGLAVDLDRASAEAALSRLRLRLVVGTEDRWGARRSAETERWLAGSGLTPDRLEYEGGHRIDDDTLRRWS